MKPITTLQQARAALACYVNDHEFVAAVLTERQRDAIRFIITHSCAMNFELAELEADDRVMKYKPATVFANAPLALHQTAAEAEIRAYRRCLGLPAQTFPDRKP